MKKTYQTPETTVINIKLQQIIAATAKNIKSIDSNDEVHLKYGGGAGAEMEMRSRSTNHWDE
jgi:hypothetical protein